MNGSYSQGMNSSILANQHSKGSHTKAQGAQMGIGNSRPMSSYNNQVQNGQTKSNQIKKKSTMSDMVGSGGAGGAMGANSMMVHSNSGMNRGGVGGHSASSNAHQIN